MDVTQHLETDAVTDEPKSFWDRHYDTPSNLEKRVNPLLVELAGLLPPGRALDLGCGAGGDTIWLAQQGWQVTSVDISSNATQRVSERARHLGVGEHVRTERHDLAQSFPHGKYDLISAQYFHTPFDSPRARILRTAARALRPGGRLLIVDHGSTAPWSWHQDPDVYYPTPTETAAELNLDPHRWRVLRADMPRRLATGPNGETATVTDNVLVLERGA